LDLSSDFIIFIFAIQLKKIDNTTRKILHETVNNGCLEPVQSTNVHAKKKKKKKPRTSLNEKRKKKKRQILLAIFQHNCERTNRRYTLPSDFVETPTNKLANEAC
jgi:hypothetical protein